MNSRVIRIWVGFWLLSAGCGGELLIPPPKTVGGCPETPCSLGFVCNDLGVCVDDGTEGPLCNPVNQVGSCLGADVCEDGVCYSGNNQPPACSSAAPAQNGTCPGTQACVNGACQDIPGGGECSDANLGGLCPGGERCVLGECFVDDDLACSQSRPDGVCPSGQMCAGGFCLIDSGSCSPFEPEGTCPAWELCVQGDCYGPVAPDACSSAEPNGRCPSGDVCVGGNCTQVTDNACSESNLTGLCPAGAACVTGRCQAITPQNGCAAGRPEGLCPGGAVCVDGACTQRPCGSGGFLCDAGSTCVANACVPSDCDLSHPVGVCMSTADVCDDGVCLPPSCSLAALEGTCPGDLECQGGSCIQPGCDVDHPNGLCPAGDVCQNGACAEGPCNASNTDGVCEGQTRVCHPTLGCNIYVDNVCCDSTMNGVTGCGVGTCAPAQCDATQVNGACPYGEYCNNGTCEAAPCSVFALDGFCSGANELCVLGKCTKSNCIGEDPSYCAPQTCDIGTNTCVTPACSPTYPDGRCLVGKACCNSTLVAGMGCDLGTCVTPPCSLEYPGGTCGGGQVCAGGNCVTPPCSATNQNGDCGPNFVCNAGTCERAACAVEYPVGACPQGQRCDGDSCETYVCSASFPTAPCPIGTLCADCAGVPCCQQPACSSTYPGGSCASGSVCSGGACVPAPCSLAFPSGACGAGFTCAAGICQPAPCSATSLNGSCAGMEPAPYGDVRVICLGGTCTPYACDADPALVNAGCYDSFGAYLPNEQCNAGICEVPPCGPQHPGGFCPSPQVCAGGGCILPACSEQVTNGACPSNQICCDASLAGTRGCDVGTCVLRDCSTTYTSGRCDAGEVCCNATLVSGGVCTTPNVGDCVAITCSAQFPTGACVGADAGKICVGGACTTPCNGATPSGWCPGAFACVEGGCSPICDTGNDRDCDGISNANEQGADTDNDGYPDDRDRDSDGDGVPDVVEAGDLSLATPPVDTDDDGTPDFRDIDSDNDFIGDAVEVGLLASVPVDTDGDGAPDLYDTDSDGDGILDRCEGTDVGAGICTYAGPVLVNPNNVLDSDNDGVKDFRDTDSDDDGILDRIEARTIPSQPGTFTALGVSHDGDDTPDYRDTDSDNDGVLDAEEDINGDGLVNCQVDGTGQPVADIRSAPACGGTYDYNPGCDTSTTHRNCGSATSSATCDGSLGCRWNAGTCVALGSKCLLAESSRVHTDSDRDDIGDAQDGVYLVCSTANLKPINLFYSRPADYALALEPQFTTSRLVRDSGSVEIGMTFDDPDSATNNGSYAVSGFIVNRVPPAGVRGTSGGLIAKAIAQEALDRSAFAGATGVSGVALVINRNFTSFDGYGVLLSRYTVTTSSAVSTTVLRDRLLARLGTGFQIPTASGGPSSTSFVLQTETLYRGDQASPVDGAVVVVASLVPASSPETQSYSYRGSCEWPEPAPVEQTIINIGDTWRYFEAETAGPSGTWNTVAFDASAWSQGASGIGCNDSANATNVTTGDARCGQTIYMRRTFNLISIPLELRLNLDYEDGYIVYVNGTQVQRTNIGSGPSWNTRASNDRANGTAVDIDVDTAILQVGTNVVAIEMHDRADRTPVSTTSGTIGIVSIPRLIATVPGTPPAGCPTACVLSGGDCVPNPDYQIPLFFADNIANGSALAQYGDDVAALCQSLVQSNGKLDFLWMPDNSVSMEAEVNQVLVSSQLFFGIMNNTEADYRVAQTTSGLSSNASDTGGTMPAGHAFGPVFNFSSGVERLNGYLMGEFTGAVSGIVDAGSPDRTVTYACSEGCDAPGTCCPACGSGTVQDPSCYFASRLPAANGPSNEFPVLIAAWSLYRGGAPLVCDGLGVTDCAATPGCVFSGGACIDGHCAAPPNGSYTQETCNGNDNATSGSTGFLERPVGSDGTEDELEPLACEWNAQANECRPNMAPDCGNMTSSAECTLLSSCADREQATCTAGNGCSWYSTSPGQCRSTTCGNLTSATNCNQNAACMWDVAGTGNGGRCTDRNAGAFCSWTGSTCVPTARASSVLCAASTQQSCVQGSGGYCQWDSGTSTCSAPSKRAFRPDAETIVVFMSDEEDCYLKDADGNGGCGASQFDGFTNFLGYNDARRLAREDAYLKMFQARGVTVFAITGDKPDRSADPARSNGGCDTNHNGTMDSSDAEPGAGYITVAEGTGGGWGSICAEDLYPSIEAIVISSLAKASPYKLEGFIDGVAVQPISSTIKVAVEVCDNANEYPTCTSGTHMDVVPRSRQDGFDYDALSNALILYGAYRPVVNGDIVVSYRYWVDNPQPPLGDPDCPCPETSPDCLCPAGQACGYSGSDAGAENLCNDESTQIACEGTPGCAWNAPLATCMPTGLCEPDPDCGPGSCGDGKVCDPTIGLCVCDVTCAATCGGGQTCDNNVVINDCQGKDQTACGVTSGCAWDADAGACFSATCGTCVCDTSCGFGCPAGQLCNDNTASATCGECYCDTTCGGGCPTGQLCNTDTFSSTCGFCQPPQCGQCGSGTVCDTATGLCVCDTLCGGGCPQGRECDADSGSSTCGQCLCDTTCGGSCPQGTACDVDTGSASCGLCTPLADCGVGGDCNPPCGDLTSTGACATNSVCRWAPWEGTGGACVPVVCSLCNSAAGLCVADPNCCGACGPDESCNQSTGECECDTQCGLSCPPGRTCDGNTASPTCGSCQCDTTCGGGCPDGLVCDDNAACDGFVDSGACQAGGCAWDSVAGQCLSVDCGRCVVDPNCGNDCQGNEACNPTTGLCEPQCPDCEDGEQCDTLTGTCVCDQTCGGGCPIGKSCDGDTGSATCGECVCDTSCGGACPAGQICDDGSTCEPLATGGVCEANLDCAADGSECFSPTCGLCRVDETCGGTCPNNQVCDPLTGLCIPDPSCGGCPAGFICDELRGTCVPIEE